MNQQPEMKNRCFGIVKGKYKYDTLCWRLTASSIFERSLSLIFEYVCVHLVPTCLEMSMSIQCSYIYFAHDWNVIWLYACKCLCAEFVERVFDRKRKKKKKMIQLRTYDKTVILWTLEQRQPIFTFHNNSPINSLLLMLHQITKYIFECLFFFFFCRRNQIWAQYNCFILWNEHKYLSRFCRYRRFAISIEFARRREWGRKWTYYTLKYTCCMFTT